MSDVAEVRAENSSDVALLNNLVLFPTPADQSMITVRQIQRRLALRGAAIETWTFSGSTVTKVFVEQPVSTRSTVHHAQFQQPTTDVRHTIEPVSDLRSSGHNGGEANSSTTVARANSKIGSRIEEYLAGNTDPSLVWRVTAEVEPRYASLVVDEMTQLVVQDRQEIGAETQRVIIDVRSPTVSVSLPVNVEIEYASMAVYVVRPLQRGEIINATDIELRPVEGHSSKRAGYIDSLKDAIGSEVMRNMSPNQIVERSSVQAARLVRKGDNVKLSIPIGDGARLVRYCRALDDGGQNDSIPVESLDKKNKYFARVTSYGEVEMMVSSQVSLR